MTSPTDDGPEARPEEPSAEEPFPCVIYISSAQGRSHADLLPSNRGRSSIVHSLIESLDLLDYDISNGDNDCNPDSQETPGREDRSINRARAIEPIPARRNDLTRFHDRDYVWTLFIIGKTLGKLIILSSSQIDALFKASNDAPSPENSFDLDACAEQPSPQKRVKRDVHDNNYNLEQVKEHETLTANAEDHGLEHDCPIFSGLESYCCYIAGGSIAAAQELRRGNADIAIFWDGGRHHATKSAAAGYCYINDIVLAILELQKNPLFDRISILSRRGPLSNTPKRLKSILYVDLDLHHGDGVAEAFETNPNVVTVSLHLWSKGFYPSTPKGHLTYSGPSPPSPAANTSLNIAIPKSGLSDENFNKLVNECIKPIFQSVNPDALVLQCGVDGLAGDPCREFNISLKGYGTAVQSILKWCRPVRPIPGADHPEEVEGGLVSNIPVLMLGGGGYHSTNAARAWAYLTSIALNRPLDLSKDTVPDSCVYWETFYNDNAAGEGLDVPSHFSRKDENSEDDIREIVDRFKIYAAALTASNS